MAKVHNDPRAKRLLMLMIAEQKHEEYVHDGTIKALAVGSTATWEGWEGEAPDCPGEGEFQVSWGQNEYTLGVKLTSTDDDWTADVTVTRTK